MVSAEVRERARPWIQETLAKSTDLDVNDMTDFVLTLLSDEDTPEQIRETLNNELREFLQNSTEDFVNALLQKFHDLENGITEQPRAAPPMAQGGQDEFRRNFRQDRNGAGRGNSRQNNFPGPGGPGGPGGMEMPAFPFPVGPDGQPMFPPNFDFSGFPGMPMKMFGNMGKFGGRGNFNNRRGGRAGRPGFHSSISSVDNDQDYLNRRLVVEKLPEDKLNEESIREWFGQFGSLTRINVNPKDSLAELEYQTHAEAKAAHTSPDAIFGNRFVKVYWRKKDENDPQAIDMEEVKRIQEIKQKQFEEKEAKRREHNAKIQELIAARAQLLQEQEEIIKATSANAGQADVSAQLAVLAEKQQHTEALKQQLEALKSEAASLGITAPSQTAGRGRGRGGFGARRASPYARGGYRGRGSMRGGRGGYSHASLDLRPKSVVVRGINMDNDEHFRSFMVSKNYSNLERQDAETVVIDFPDRQAAEQFFSVPNDLPEVGRIEKAWIRRDVPDTSDDSFPPQHDTVMELDHYDQPVM